MAEEKKKTGEITRREFLKDAGLIVGGATIGSTVLLAACGGETETVTEKVTTTVQGGTSTVTKTEQVGEVTKTTTVIASKFVCPIDGLEFDSLAALQAHFNAEHGGEAPAAALNVISLTINGEYFKVQVNTGQTLLALLHDVLGLTGTKYFCDQGACGGCSVIMNGRPVLSCTILAIECDGADIQTVEGIAKEKHPLIDTYVEYHCMQCGYCTPGFIVTAKALLDRKPDANEDDIRDALAGNLCRCGTYPQHILAVLEAERRL